MVHSNGPKRAVLRQMHETWLFSKLLHTSPVSSTDYIKYVCVYITLLFCRVFWYRIIVISIGPSRVFTEAFRCRRDS